MVKSLSRSSFVDVSFVVMINCNVKYVRLQNHALSHACSEKSLKREKKGLLSP